MQAVGRACGGAGDHDVAGIRIGAIPVPVLEGQPVIVGNLAAADIRRDIDAVSIRVVLGDGIGDTPRT
jgi:hypothetical protein